jgi:N-carbamoyl-L-amino-acid hydrolase
VITADDLATRLAGLDGLGDRLAWTPEDAACREWFAGQAAALGHRVETDPAGNLWALPDGDGPWWGTGSHLDSVRQGGRFDGPLGVAAGFAVAAAASVPLAVVDFADEEGARFNTPTFGSRALVGRLDVDDVLARVDDDGVTLRDALAAAGVDPDGLTGAPAWLERLHGFVELHIDQTTELFEQGRPYGVVSGLAARVRLQVDLHGRADHAGTTTMADRSDALADAARLIVTAIDAAGPDMRVTATRMLVVPNALTTVPSHVRLWLDARAPEDTAAWEATLPDAEITVASRSPATPFDPRVRAALGGGAELVSFAGHDAGVLAQKLPAGMVFVRNPTGISHAPEEHVSLDDAAAGATAMLHALEELAA